ncbi:UNKNOWN [Stylonychia lemnae]|uniref:Uncharacterized protein n=1 Tax=Stylonychia lemnae TaxID=5949 RepID=A0A078ARV3_STYLE|nr:UNKNOWN [Stylonychia lemnae]|eukprot:CDW84716.1 UNKNOWN [Stylonychia lemnae]
MPSQNIRSLFHRQLNETLQLLDAQRLLDVSETYTHRKFECIGNIIKDKDEIWLVYTASNDIESTIFTIKIGWDPLISISFVIEYVQSYLQQNVNTKQFKYDYKLFDLYYLGFIDYSGSRRAFMSSYSQQKTYSSVISNESQGQKIAYSVIYNNNFSQLSGKIGDHLYQLDFLKNQSNIDTSQKYVKKLNPQQNQQANSKTQLNDCYLGMECQIYYQIFTLYGQCQDELDKQRSYFIEINVNDTNRLGHLKFYNSSNSSTLVANISTKTKSRLLQSKSIGQPQKEFLIVDFDSYIRLIKVFPSWNICQHLRKYWKL